MSPESTCAAAPFDHLKADIILRSSDNIDFRVFKLFLSLASPFFETLFELPQPTETSGEQEVKDGLIVIRVPEDGRTLDSLLRFCYPCTLAEDPKLEVFEDLVVVLEAARKYSLDIVENKVRQAVSNPEILADEPLRCFAIARRGRVPEETLLAAKYTLTQPLIPQWFQEITLITASDLLALLSYHQRCGDAVYAMRMGLFWIKSHYKSSQGCAWLSGNYPDGTLHRSTNDFRNSNVGGGASGSVISYKDCPCPRSPTPRYRLFGQQSLKWWEDFMEDVFVALRDKPCRATVESVATKTVQSVKAQNCPTCSAKISEGMREFSEFLTRKVEEVVSEISLVF